MVELAIADGIPVESKTQRTSAALPDVPMRIISPRPVLAGRPSWPPALAKVDAARRALVTRFPQGQFVTADGATHQWLPFERPDVVIDVVRGIFRSTDRKAVRAIVAVAPSTWC